ncbi:hypothetical protein NQZ68_007909 [Dissostichus eleginoides]|nr:hypothetical protein NQZ68_007909 [Dissostichus eleginoides]
MTDVRKEYRAELNVRDKQGIYQYTLWCFQALREKIMSNLLPQYLATADQTII